MRPTTLFVLAMLAAVVGGCAGTTGQRLGAAPKQAAPSARAQAAPPQISPTQTSPTQADLDSLAYGPAYARPGYGSQPSGNAAAASGAHTQTVPQAPTVAQAPLPAPTSAPPAARAAAAASGSPAVAAPAPASTAAPTSARAQVAVAVPVMVPAEAFEGEPPYTLDTGDRLRIVVFGQDGLSNSYAVDASGMITMPLIKAVSARGLTTQQLARVISDRLRGGYVREPHIAIEVEIYRPFFILGEVTTPGQYAYVPHMTVESAVAVAGGFTPRAYRWDIRIDRPYGGGIMRSSVPLITKVRPGDTIIIKERWF